MLYRIRTTIAYVVSKNSIYLRVWSTRAASSKTEILFCAFIETTMNYGH